MSYQGVIIEESLTDPSVLKEVHVLWSVVEPVTAEDGTPELDHWTLHTFEVDDTQAEALAKRLCDGLDDGKRGHWFADFKNDAKHYVVFPGKIFCVDRSETDAYKPVTLYGLSVGIPAQQLAF